MDDVTSLQYCRSFFRVGLMLLFFFLLLLLVSTYSFIYSFEGEHKHALDKVLTRYRLVRIKHLIIDNLVMLIEWIFFGLFALPICLRTCIFYHIYPFILYSFFHIFTQ